MALQTDGETLFAVTMMIGAALVIAYIGYRIRYRGDVVLIAGYDADRVTDDAGLANLVGGIVIVLGLVHVVFGLGLLVFPPNLTFWLAYLAVMSAGIGVVTVRGRRYTE